MHVTRNSLFIAFGLAAILVADAVAQVKILPGETTTVTATVEAIEQSSRTVTLRDPKGQLRTITVPQSVERFSEVKIGDRLTVTYYDTITIRKKDPGEPDVDTLTGAKTPTAGAKPAGTAAVQQTITATIDQIDMNVPSISFKGPRGWSYSSKVRDKKALSQVKVGDRVDITWTEAMLTSMTPAK
jgi:hypothetical protein